MRTIRRRARGAIGLGILWGIAWSVAGGIPRWLLGVETDAPIPLLTGLAGTAAGVLFAVLLALDAQRRHDQPLARGRVATAGGAAGVVLAIVLARLASIPFHEAAALGTALTLAGGLSAAGTLTLARRADTPPLAPADPHAVVDAGDPDLPPARGIVPP